MKIKKRIGAWAGRLAWPMDYYSVVQPVIVLTRAVLALSWDETEARFWAAFSLSDSGRACSSARLAAAEAAALLAFPRLIQLLPPLLLPPPRQL